MTTALQETTLVSGYFNPNNCQIQLQISSLNASILLKPKEFILDAKGRKINDPIFDRYTKEYGLAKEMSKTPIPILSIRKPSVSTEPQYKVISFAGTQNPDIGVNGEIKSYPAPMRRNPALEGTSPVRAYTIEQAVKLKIIPKSQADLDNTTPDVKKDIDGSEAMDSPVGFSDSERIAPFIDSPRLQKINKPISKPIAPSKTGTIADKIVAGEKPPKGFFNKLFSPSDKTAQEPIVEEEVSLNPGQLMQDILPEPVLEEPATVVKRGRGRPKKNPNV